MGGNGSQMGGGVMLGGRQYTITISRQHNENLEWLAKMQRKSPTMYAIELLEWAVLQSTRMVQGGISTTRVLLSGFQAF